MPWTDSGTDIYHKAWQIVFMACICFSGQELWSFPSPKSQARKSVQGKRGFPSTGPRSLNDVTPQLAADGAHESRGHKDTSAPFCIVLSCLEKSRLLVEEKLWRRVRHQVRVVTGMLDSKLRDLRATSSSKCFCHFESRDPYNKKSCQKNFD